MTKLEDDENTDIDGRIYVGFICGHDNCIEIHKGEYVSCIFVGVNTSKVGGGWNAPYITENRTLLLRINEDGRIIGHDTFAGKCNWSKPGRGGSYTGYTYIRAKGRKRKRDKK